jgi:hypothetical protein
VESRFTGSNLHFRKLGSCADVEQQGFELTSYDLNIAADVVHATPDMLMSQLLKPTGSLALVGLSGASPCLFPLASLPGGGTAGLMMKRICSRKVALHAIGERVPRCRNIAEGSFFHKTICTW